MSMPRLRRFERRRRRNTGTNHEQRLSYTTRLRVESLEDRRLLSVTAEMVRDINQTGADVNPHALVDVAGTLFFTADDGVHGTELWKSDGTAEGTLMVKDIRPGGVSSFSRYFANVDGTLFFVADDGVHGRELWTSDGSEAGTVLVKDIRPGEANYRTTFSLGDDRSFVTVEGTLFFVADDGVLGHELWRSDGTAAGTTIVKDVRPGPDGSYPIALTNVNGTVFFSQLGSELWKSDGTAEGTVLVEDTRIEGSGGHIDYTANVAGVLFYTVRASAGTTELWKSDGTAEGTILLNEFDPLRRFRTTPYLTDVNGTLFFFADDKDDGYGLWKSDGTTEGTVFVKFLQP